MREDPRRAVVANYLKQLRLSRMASDCEALAREAEQRGLGYLGYLQALLEGELAHRQEQRLRQRLKAAAFPYQKRLEDFDFSLVPAVSKVRLLELAQGAFLASHENVLFLGKSGIGKTHLLTGLGRALCLAGYRVLFRPAVTLATEREVAHKALRLPRLLAQSSLTFTLKGDLEQVARIERFKSEVFVFCTNRFVSADAERECAAMVQRTYAWELRLFGQGDLAIPLDTTCQYLRKRFLGI